MPPCLACMHKGRQPECLKGQVEYGTVYRDMHLKDLLGSIARVEYYIPVLDFYLMLMAFNGFIIINHLFDQTDSLTSSRLDELLQNLNDTVEPLLRGLPDKRPTLHDNVNLSINVLISTPDQRPSLLRFCRLFLSVYIIMYNGTNYRNDTTC